MENWDKIVIQLDEINKVSDGKLSLYAFKSGNRVDKMLNNTMGVIKWEKWRET